MAVRPKQIGAPSSTEAQYLYEISKQLDQLIGQVAAVVRNTGGYPTTTTTTSLASQSTILTIVNNSTIDHGAPGGTFYIIYNGSTLSATSGTTLDSGETMSFTGISTLDSNNVLQLYSNTGLLPFYVDTVLDSSSSNPVTYSSITGNGTNSPYVNGIAVDVTLAGNGITITLIDQP